MDIISNLDKAIMEMKSAQKSSDWIYMDLMEMIHKKMMKTPDPKMHTKYIGIIALLIYAHVAKDDRSLDLVKDNLFR